MTTFLMVVQLLVCLGLITVVLLQDSSGEGLGAIGGGSKMFFSKASATEKIMEAATKYLAIAFILLSVVLSSLRY